MIEYAGKDDGIRTPFNIEPKTTPLPDCGFLIRGWPCENKRPDHTTHYVNDLSAKQMELMERIIRRDRA